MNDKTELPEKDVKFLRRETSAGRKMFRDVMEVSAIAEDLMSRPVITITTEAPIQDVVKLMHEHHIASVVVAEENELRGIVKRDDIIQEVTT
jgi:CBS domain-containing protein